VKSKLIFDSPSIQSLRQRYASGALALGFWLFWFHLWVPLVTAFGWWFQFELFKQGVLYNDGFESFMNSLPTFIAITLAMALIQVLWSLYNFTRFRGLDRRKPIPAVNNDSLINMFSISKEDLSFMQSRKFLTIEIDENDNISIKSK